MAESTAQINRSVEQSTEQTNPTHANIEVDLEATDNESTYDQEISTYTASLTSSVLNYRHENGRTYHGYRDGAYLLPNDESEKDRLDMMHEMMLVMLDRQLFLAPIDSPRRVLDLGTGTGIWAIQFADQFPAAEVVGTDLSPIQPSLVPPNCKFIIDDMEDEWVNEQPYDFIHARFLVGGVKNFSRLLKRCYEHTAPGGWVEFQDWDTRLYSEDGTLKGTSLEKYYKAILPAYDKAGVLVYPGPYLENWFREAGFVDVHAKKYRLPLGTWPKDRYYKTLGTWNLMSVESGFEAAAMAVLTRNEGWSQEQVSALVEEAWNDARSHKVHGVFDYYFVYGRRPE